MSDKFVLKFSLLNVISGLILGILAGWLHFYLVRRSMENAIKGKNRAFVLSLLASIARPLVLAVPMVIAVLLPQYVNLLAAAAGMTVHKLYLFFAGFRKTRR